MSEYPYCTVPGKLSEFMKKIRDIGVPGKVTTSWLPTIGFGSKNDRSIIPVLKFVGLVDPNGVPSQHWLQYRGAGGERALAGAVQSAYKELFNTYPDAPSRSVEELKNFIRGHSSYGSQAVGKAVQTFKALADHADFQDGAIRVGASNKQTGGIPETDSATSKSPGASITAAPSLHIDIQLHISPEASMEQIEKMFESMAKYLYKNQ
jgi:hypothetical protein